MRSFDRPQKDDIQIMTFDRPQKDDIQIMTFDPPQKVVSLARARARARMSSFSYI